MKRLLKKLIPHVREMGQGRLAMDGYFRCSVRASLVRGFEFALYAHGAHANSFFSGSALRGICEDLIVCPYLSAKQNRDDVVERLAAASINESIEK